MDIKDIENLAQLSRLDLSQGEKESLLKDLDSILGYVKQVESLKSSNVEQEYRLYNVWREDELELREFSRDLILKQFPDSQPARPHDGSGAGEDGFLKVKKIL